MFIAFQKLTYSDIKRKLSEATSIEEMEAIRIAKGYKIGFLLHSFKTIEQFQEYEKFKNYKKGWARLQAKNYL